MEFDIEEVGAGPSTQDTPLYHNVQSLDKLKTTVPNAVPELAKEEADDDDWSPATKQQRTKFLETVDTKIADLQTLLAKNEDFKRQLTDFLGREKRSLNHLRETIEEKMKLCKTAMDEANKKTMALEHDLTKMENQMLEQKNEFMGNLRCLESENASLADQLAESERQLQNLKLSAATMKITSAMTHASALRDSQSPMDWLVGEVESLSAEKQCNRQTIMKLAERRITTLQNQLEALNAELVLQKHEADSLQANKNRVRELEEQLEEYQAAMPGKMLMVETITNLKNRVRALEKTDKELSRQKEINKKQEAELLDWHRRACQMGSDISDDVDEVVTRCSSPPIPWVAMLRLQEMERSLLMIRADLNEVLSQLREAHVNNSEVGAAQLGKSADKISHDKIK